jgi:hypothetical protein
MTPTGRRANILQRIQWEIETDVACLLTSEGMDPDDDDKTVKQLLEDG